MSETPAPHANRLIREKSPYLLQHAYNPVDWYPWGDEAFAKAKSEDKPILVSIGYSTCHWCHVMERESYENIATAELMNRYLVNVKVDREERPDVDKIYMTAVSAMTGSGGWPLNVFLTPDLQPFFGGTYFPPEARWGQPGWPDVVQQIGESWRNAGVRPKLLKAGRQITDSLRQYVEGSALPAEGDPAWLDNGYAALAEIYDRAHGGFGPAPKFPMPVYHHFLMRYFARSGKTDARDMSVQTLRAMAQGGIYDQLGGGFARYSTDTHWHVPHFEKMLYDNAQLAANYLEGYQITQDAELKRIAYEILAYIQRDMTHPEGGFYSAEDADSVAPGEAHKREGAFYVWTKPEVARRLEPPEAEVFMWRYGVRENGNVTTDPHGEFQGQNVLYAAHPIEETARQFGLTEDETRQRLDRARDKLFRARSERPRPHLDDKIISGWNGLMISAFAKGYRVLGHETYRQAAERAAAFLQKHLYDSSSRTLYRRWRDGERAVAGIADDYAFVVQGLLDLYECRYDPRWLDWAERLSDEMNKRFYDSGRGGYFMTAAEADSRLLLRIKEDMDNVEPSASSVAVLNLLRLAQLTGREDYRNRASETLRCFGSNLKDSPRALPMMLAGLGNSLTEPLEIVIAGRLDDPETQDLLQTVQERFLPHRSLIVLTGDDVRRRFAERLPYLATMMEIAGRPAAYVCEHHRCRRPVSTPEELSPLLDASKGNQGVVEERS